MGLASRAGLAAGLSVAAGTMMALAPSAIASPAPTQVRGELLVRYSHGTSAGQRASIRARDGVTLVGTLRIPGVEVVHVKSGSLAAAERKLSHERAVRSAEPNHYLHASSACPVAPATNGCLPSSPSDPKFSLQYGLYNTGAS